MLLEDAYPNEIDRRLSPIARVAAFVHGWFLRQWGTNSAGAAFALAAFSFVVWRRHIIPLFQSLLNSGSLSPIHEGDSLQKLATEQIEEYRKSLYCRKRFWVIGAVLALALGVALAIDRPRSLQTLLNSSDIFDRLTAVQTLTCLYLIGVLYGYAFGAAAWVIFVTAQFIREIPRRFRVEVIPGHPDRCGGLRPLGDFCLLMAAPVLIGIVVSGFFALKYLLESGSDLTRLHDNELAFFVFNGLAMTVFLIPLALIIFFWSLWRFHQTMLTQRRQRQDAHALLENQHRKLVQCALLSGDSVSAKAHADLLKTIQDTESARLEYPVWPFDWATLAKFATPQILSAAGVAVPVLKKLFES